MSGWTVSVALLASSLIAAPKIHRQTFEGKQTQLRLGLSDGKIELTEHAIVADQPHSGRQSERLRLQSTSGTYCFVEYDFGVAAIIEELTISAWVFASRPGTTIVARVVLPHTIDDATQKPLVTEIRGDTCDVSGRWRRLNLHRLDLALRKQQPLLAARRKKPVDLRGAYVDLVMFDVHSGLGEFDVRFDDLEIGPVVVGPDIQPSGKDERALPAPVRTPDGDTPHAETPKVFDRAGKHKVAVVGGQFEIGGRPALLRAIRRTDAPLEVLHEAGFNSIMAPWPVTPQLAERADRLGLMLTAMLPPLRSDGSPLLSASLESLDPAPEAPAASLLVGDALDRASEASVREAVAEIRTKDRNKGRPIAGDIADGLLTYTDRKYFDMVGVRRYPLATTLDLDRYRVWLEQRRNLGQPGALYWTWIQTHLPQDYARLVYGDDADRGTQAPIGPQPEQIRLLTYLAIAAGYKGVAYTSDRALSEAYGGRDRMLQMALLNRELMLIEQFVAGGKTPISIRTSHPDVGAVAIQHQRGVLVLAFWKRPEAQFVLGQASLGDLQVVVENAPEAALAFQISLAEVRGVKRSRDLGGVRVSIPEFDTVAMVVLTTDATLYMSYQEKIAQIAREAARWQKELADIQLAKTEQVEARLKHEPHDDERVRKALADAHAALDQSKAALDRHDYRSALLQSVRGERFTRAAQQWRWQAAVKDLASPVADPFAVSYYTLPEMRDFAAGIRQAAFSDSLLEGGDFEREGNLDAVGWSYAPHSADGLESSAMLVGDGPHGGRRCLELRLAPAAGKQRPTVVENSRAEMVTPPVRVRPGQVARISGFVRLPSAPAGSVDGAMIWDSLGGQTLALRYTAATNWRPFVLYRPVTTSGELRVHLSMTALGAAQFDDIRVELADNAVVPLAGRSRPNPLR